MSEYKQSQASTTNNDNIALDLVGYFSISLSTTESLDINFDTKKDNTEICPINQRSLYIDCERTLQIIKLLLCTESTQKKYYVGRLADISIVGLDSTPVNTELATLSLRELTSEILNIEGSKIKNKYMNNLGIMLLIVTIFSIFLIHMLYILNSHIFIVNFLYTTIGTMIGMYISFGARNYELTFEQLSCLEKDKMGIITRSIYMILVSNIFLFFLNSKIISIPLLTYNSTSWVSPAQYHILLGIICGLVESKLGIKLLNTAIKATS